MKNDWLTELKIEQMVAVESDCFYDQTEEIGDIAVQAFRDQKEEKKTSQMNELKKVCYSTNRLSEIYDFIKKQTGRLKEWQKEDFGRQLLKKLRALDQKAKEIVEKLDLSGEEEKAARQRKIHLLLCREYVKHLVAHFLYRSGPAGGVDR